MKIKLENKFYIVIPFNNQHAELFVSSMKWESDDKAKEYSKKFGGNFGVVELKNMFGNKLLNCPCCGGEMSIKKEAEHSYLFVCKSCGLNKQTDSDRQTAIFRWNFLRKSNDYVDDYYGWRSCPVCGYKYTCSNENLEGTHNLLCRCCSCSTKECKTEKEAVSLWNRRK